jgi:hypothetical protein
MASNDVTEQQAEHINKALEDAAVAEAKCEKLEAENERLKNKYEPANGVIIDETRAYWSVDTIQCPFVYAYRLGGDEGSAAAV